MSNFQQIDQTGYGLGSGGFAVSPSETAELKRARHEMDRMADFMQKFDPAIRRALDTAVRTHVRNGSSPEEARRAAFSSSSGQAMSDFFMAMRTSGALGQGNPLAYGRDILQGVSGGGFNINMSSPGAAMRSQGVMGSGIISGQASLQLAKDVMTNLYGAGGSDPKALYGANMQDAGEVFRMLSARGALGKIGTLKNYGDKAGAPDNINEKLANARRQEGDSEILKALEGTDAENIQAKINEAIKKGDKKIEHALKDHRDAGSTLVLDDKNTKRVTDLQRETLKGIANLKSVYGELTNSAAMVQLESLSGIRITNNADQARKANNMVQSIIGVASATGNDPRATMEMMLAQRDGKQGRLAGMFGGDLGQGGVNDSIGKEIAAGMQKSSWSSAMQSEAASRNLATELNGSLGTNIKSRSAQSFIADNEKQQERWASQNKAMTLASGLAGSTFSGDAGFNKEYQAIMRDAKSAQDPAQRAAAEARAERLVRSRTGASSAQYLQTRQGKDALASADYDDLTDVSNTASAAASKTFMSDKILRDTGMLDTAGQRSVSGAFKSKLGASGMQLLAGKTKSERDAQIKKFMDGGFLSQSEAANLGKHMDAVTDAQFASQIENVANASGGGRAMYDTMVGNAAAESRMNAEQKMLYSNSKGLDLKSIMNAVLSDPDKKGLLTDTQQMFAVQAMHKEGLAGDIDPIAKINSANGISQKEMDDIRKASGDKNFSIHKKLGFDSEEEMLAAQKDATQNVTARMMKELKQRNELMIGGTDDETYVANSDQRAKIREKATNFEKAVRYGDITGARKEDDVSDAQREIMNTGKTSKGGIFKMKVDGEQAVYDNDGDTSKGWFNMNWNDEKNNPEDKAHFSQAGKYLSLANRTNSAEEGAGMVEANAMLGGEMLRGMEAQLEVMKKAKADGAKIIDTKDVNGTNVRQDMDTTIKAMTDAIGKLKNDDGGTVTKEMTVQVMHVIREERD